MSAVSILPEVAAELRLPRLWTRPLATGRGQCPCGCSLSPANSYGFAVIRFANEVLRAPLDLWQAWLVIHAGEIRPDGRPRFRKLLIIVARQNGKALDCAVDILTANRGWTKMGDLEVGDEVYHPDGKPTRVTEAHPVRYDRPCYRVTTTDGRSVVADGEHLWTVQDVRRVTREGRRGEKRTVTREWETLTTEQLLERGLTRDARGKEMAYRLPRQHAIQSPDVDLPIDPYLLGAWLGDGSSKSASIWSGDQDVLETRALLEQAGAQIVSSTRARTAWRLGFKINAAMRDGFESRARRLEVWGNKHIPDLYRTAGLEQRLALLRGLMDTDGSISKAGQAEFCSSNQTLAEGVLYLVRSLGWRAGIKESDSSVAGRVAGRRWRVTFSPARGEPSPFLLERKSARVPERKSRGDERHAVSIRSIEAVESRPVRCIKVAREDGQFLAGRDLIATHNTHLLKVLTLFWLFIDRWPVILGQSTTLAMAAAVWVETQEMAQAVPELMAEFGTVLRGNTNPHWRTAGRCYYRIGASTRKGGRSLSVDRLVVDELREQENWESYNASMPTMNARPYAQAFMISNQGDDKSVVLESLRKRGMRQIALGEQAAGVRTRDLDQELRDLLTEMQRVEPDDIEDDEIGLFEWSAQRGAAPDNPVALLAANPNANQPHTHSPSLRSLINDARAAMQGEADELAKFRTEILCQRVHALDAAIDPEGWKDCLDEAPAGLLPSLRNRLACFLDVAPDQRHVSLAGAVVMDDDRVRVEEIASWPTVHLAREELPALLAKIRPRKFGWMPGSSAASMTTTLASPEYPRPGVWPPRGVVLEEVRSEVHAVCMSFASEVLGGTLAHSGQELADAHVLSAAKLWRGDAIWVFSRKGGHCDMAYAMAGAAFLARSIPRPRPMRLVSPSARAK